MLRNRLPAEIDDLAKTFNAMLAQIEGAFARVMEFSDDIAHELRTPVNNILGTTEVALGKARSGEEYREVLQSTLEEAARISAILQSLVFLSRTEERVDSKQTEIVDLGHEFAILRDFYEPAAAEAGVKIVAVADEELKLSVDRTLLQRAVGNLIDNAIRHTPTGGRVTLTGRKEANVVLIAVEDTGSGIPPLHLPRVFERFYRVDQIRSGHTGNVGLGLAIVKSIAERHGGSVEIESKTAEGTRVALRFPTRGR
jgi:two-component system heavy metal sensor histidine kinase CusS